MFQLETTRLILLQTPRHVLQQRLQSSSFSTDVTLDGSGEQDAAPRTLHVHFPPEWPGDPLGFFPSMITAYDEAAAQGGAYVTWGGTLIERAQQVAIGQMGCKGMPDAEGDVEIGYGINSAYQGRGYATEMVQALATWLLAQPTVRRIIAECNVDNIGSIRVLEKSDFHRTGTRFDEEDGDLIIWARTR
jgi:[ribosomal protein S5]-alanine N-acetyltransferase